MKVYNTLSKRKEELVSRREGEIAMYVCGLTVYNYMHIGNARTFINFDMIRRYLEYRGRRVVFVRNITDVDDKIIARAAEEGVGPQEIALKYEQAFRDDTRALGFLEPTHEPRATETIPEMIDLVAKLVERNLAYVVDGNVWFRVRGFSDYGKLSGRSLDEMRAGERVEPDPGKEDPMDFALWKRSKPGEPAWDSPWGPGRPGWHLECSAMSLKYLGPDFDIHGGAQDLIFPHHENEVAQSEGATDQPFVRYWIHGGLLNIDQEKMSKSLGNVMLLRDLLKTWSPQSVRMLMLGTHYRNPLDFSREGLEQARANVGKVGRALKNIDYARRARLPEDTEKSRALLAAVARAREDFVAAMDDDFNTAEALAVVFGLVKEANQSIEGAALLPGGPALDAVAATLSELVCVLGIDMRKAAPSSDMSQSIENKGLQSEGLLALAEEVCRSKMSGLDEAVEALLDARAAARRDRDWARADFIRDNLIKYGIEIEDTPAGSRWSLRA